MRSLLVPVGWATNRMVLQLDYIEYYCNYVRRTYVLLCMYILFFTISMLDTDHKHARWVARREPRLTLDWIWRARW